MRRMGRIGNKRGDVNPQEELVYEGKKHDAFLVQSVDSIEEKKAEERQSTGEAIRQSTRDDHDDDDDDDGRKDSSTPIVTDSFNQIKRLHYRRSIMLGTKRILQLRERRGSKRQKQIIAEVKKDTVAHATTPEDANIQQKTSSIASFDVKEDQSPISSNPTRIDLRRTASTNMRATRRRVVKALTPQRFRSDISSCLIRKGELARLLSIPKENDEKETTTTTAESHLSPIIPLEKRSVLENKMIRRRSIPERLRALELHLDGYTEDESVSDEIIAAKTDDSPIGNMAKKGSTKFGQSFFAKKSSITSWRGIGYGEGDTQSGDSQSGDSFQFESTDDEESDVLSGAFSDDSFHVETADDEESGVLSGTFSDEASFTDGASYEVDGGIATERVTFSFGSEADEESFTDDDGGEFTDDDGDTMGDTDDEEGGTMGGYTDDESYMYSDDDEDDDDDDDDDDDETCTNTIERIESNIVEDHEEDELDKDVSVAFSLLSFIM
eukprot:scaffold1362_cov163-Amphora_coffeaeformis.AAC.17